MSQEKITYQGKIIEVVEQEVEVGGKTKIFEIARRSPGTRTIIQSDDNKILLTREFRHEVNDFDYRLPGGKVFDTLSEYNDFLSTNPTDSIKMEAAISGAQKELVEEVGLPQATLELLYVSKCGATVEWNLFYFLTHANPDELQDQALEHGEDITVGWYGKEDAKKIALNSNTMSEDRSVAVLLRFLENLGN